MRCLCLDGDVLMERLEIQNDRVQLIVLTSSGDLNWIGLEFI